MAGDETPSRHSTRVDHIPVLWVEPRTAAGSRRLVLFLPQLGGTKERTAELLEDLAALGFVALSFDPWLHGERGTESRDVLATRGFGAFRRHMWPILGHTTLDALRVIDWATATLGVERLFESAASRWAATSPSHLPASTGASAASRPWWQPPTGCGPGCTMPSIRVGRWTPASPTPTPATSTTD
jgi:hypothetical protein